MRRVRRLWLTAILAGLAVVLAAVSAPLWLERYWRAAGSNPVRRGVARAEALGCFACHGHLGRQGLPDAGARGGGVPAWADWRRHVTGPADARELILEGSGDGKTPDAIHMPPYRDLLRGSDLDDLVAAFAVLSGMSAPPPGSAAEAGQAVARRAGCFGCHGPAGAGGVPNPGSLSGSVPGWYGAEFADLVRGRAEFDGWIREGSIERLRESRLARRYLERQPLSMPAYPELAPGELDALWAYASWLGETEGGLWGMEAD